MSDRKKQRHLCDHGRLSTAPASRPAASRSAGLPSGVQSERLSALELRPHSKVFLTWKDASVELINGDNSTWKEASFSHGQSVDQFAEGQHQGSVSIASTLASRWTLH